MKKNILKVLLFLVLANVGFGDIIQILGDSYSIYKGNVYYGNKILEGANPKTAELIGFSLLKDDKNVYYMGEKIKDVKIKNFEKLGQNYWKNDNKIYYRDEKIENADIMSFKVLNEDFAKDKNNVYIGNSSIGLWKLDKIENPETFEFLSDTISTDSFYGKDKYNVYYVNRIFLSCFGTYTWIGFKVEGINRDKVKFLNKKFIKDDKNIYFEGKILEDVDYNTFEVLPNGEGKDKNRSYEYLTKDEWKWF